MDADETTRLQTWLDNNWKHGPCPVCTKNAWSTNPKIGQIFNDGTFSLGGTTYPVILISCDTCGYTIPVNAIIAGVVPREEKDGDTPDNQAATT